MSLRTRDGSMRPSAVDDFSKEREPSNSGTRSGNGVSSFWWRAMACGLLALAACADSTPDIDAIESVRSWRLASDEARERAARAIASTLDEVDFAGMVSVDRLGSAALMTVGPRSVECVLVPGTPTTSAFLVARREASESLWHAAMGAREDIESSRSQLPKTHLTRDEATEFARRLGGRLPTSREWDLVCRLGEQAGEVSTPDAAGRAAVGPGAADVDAVRMEAVESGPEDGLGLWNVRTNVSEWVADDGVNEFGHGIAFFRGGSFVNPARSCAEKSHTSLRHKFPEIGVRVVFDID